MGPANDPAKWMVVGLLACIQATVWMWRRSSEPLVFKNAIPGIATIVCSSCCFCCGMSPGMWSVATWATPIPIICGLALSLKAGNLPYRFVSVIAGLVGSYLFVSTSVHFVATKAYIASRPSWADQSSIYQTLRDLPYLPENVHIPAGYINNAPIRNSLLAKKAGTLTVDQPVTLWHSWFTGLYGKRQVNYRLWSNGHIQAGYDDLRVIREGIPKGQENQNELPLDTFDSPILFEAEARGDEPPAMTTPTLHLE